MFLYTYEESLSSDEGESGEIQGTIQGCAISSSAI